MKKKCPYCDSVFEFTDARRVTCGAVECKKENSLHYTRRWRAENRDKTKENSRRWAKENPKKCQVVTRLWLSRNPDKKREYDRQAQNNRRSRIRSTGGRSRLPAVDWIKEQDGKCARCDSDISLVGYDIRHIIPIHEKGDNSRENIEALCIPCHNEAHGKSVPESYFNPCPEQVR